jgi:hypothetical protein
MNRLDFTKRIGADSFRSMQTEKKFIVESDPEVSAWMEDARKVKIEDLQSFVSYMLDGYSHDQNTIVHAMVAGAMAAISAMNSHAEGGIGEAQAHKLLGLFIRKWARIDGPAKMISWAGLLNPENKSAIFEIPTDVADLLIKSAKNVLKLGSISSDEQKKHLEQIAAGNFPWGFEVKQENENG